MRASWKHKNFLLLLPHFQRKSYLKEINQWLVCLATCSSQKTLSSLNNLAFNMWNFHFWNTALDRLADARALSGSTLTLLFHIVSFPNLVSWWTSSKLSPALLLTCSEHSQIFQKGLQLSLHPLWIHTNSHPHQRAAAHRCDLQLVPQAPRDSLKRIKKKKKIKPTKAKLLVCDHHFSQILRISVIWITDEWDCQSSWFLLIYFIWCGKLLPTDGSSFPVFCSVIWTELLEQRSNSSLRFAGVLY